ncbi:MAG: hypothetical protein GY697_22195 [Desulfobacterales bacterium]|nr:hypothetical protein [Desulfobacterales bacterium]
METQSEQEKMDQLMAELQGSAAGDDTEDPATDAAAETANPDRELSDQEKMDALMAELQGGESSGEPEEEPDEQARMDRSNAEPEVNKEEEPVASESPEADPPEEELDEQAKMDQLMAELQGGADTGKQEEPAAAESSEADGPEEELDEQARMDQLVADQQGDTGGGPDDDDLRQSDEAQTVSDEATGDFPEEALPPELPDEDEGTDDIQALDDEETDLDGYGENDTFASLDDGEDSLEGYGEEGDEEQAIVEPLEAAEPELETRPKPVPRERKSLFKIQEDRISALPERTRPGQWPRIAMILAGITVLLAALFIGRMVYKNHSADSPEPKTAKLAEPQEQMPDEGKLEEKPVAVPDREVVRTMENPTDNPADSIIQDRFETIDTLRQSLQIKQAEITTLKKEYEAGIKQSMDRIAGLAAEKQIKNFKAAMAVRRIAFELQTMQRRKAYIRKLDGPYNRLLSGSEALLYIRRLTEIDLAVAPFVGGLETGQLLKRIDTEIDRHQLTGDKLQVATGGTEAPGLEPLWKETLLKGRTKNTGNLSVKDPAAGNVMAVEEVTLSNSEIWEQICNDMPDNKYRLTEISSEAAVCLAKWKGKELFLNRLTTLTARQAKALADWKGEWIGLNGLVEMDRATARALFKWNGKRLSLNGFTEFPPGIARYLAKWKGKQLELMGLEILSHKTAVYFSEWKKDGGKLYIPNKFYRRK